MAKETVNRLSPETAGRVFDETLPRGQKPLQLFTQGGQLRSIHAASYTRLFNADLLALIQEFAVGFEPPPKGFNGATGLYGGEQDMFCFLIDPAGWTEIGGEAFAPGMFVWNSEVGCRSVGIETFWFQAVCANHIVWDATEVIEFSRKHTANVHDALSDIRCAIQSLVQKRDQRRDAFVKAVQQAMVTTLGSDAEEVQKAMSQNGIPRALIKEAMEIAQEKGRFTVFSLVDALTRIAGKIVNAGERIEWTRRRRACWPWPSELSWQSGNVAGLPSFQSLNTKGGHFHAQNERKTESEAGSRDSALAGSIAAVWRNETRNADRNPP